uniref:Nucleocapsid n=1 Tax=Jonchet virus TaxID=1664809 RepID=A0A0H4B3S2_9VIRU|nr:nucleocapsid [Jonchet virus]
MHTKPSMTQELNLNDVREMEIPLTLDFPNALSRQDIGKAKSLEECLAQFRSLLPPLDENGIALIKVDQILSLRNIERFIEAPGFGFKLIFNINTKPIVEKIKSTQSTSFLKFKDSTQAMKVLMIKGTTRLTQAQQEENFTIGDLQKVSAIYTNSIVDAFYKDRSVLAMLPQARSRFSDSCVEALSAYMFDEQSTSGVRERVPDVVKAMNFGCLRKPHQCSTSRHYSAELAVAMGIYGMLTSPNPSPETMRIGKETLKKIVGQAPASAARARDMLGIMIENSGAGTAMVDQLIEEASLMINKLSIPKGMGIASAPKSTYTVSAPGPSKVADQAKKELAEIQRQIEFKKAFLAGLDKQDEEAKKGEQSKKGVHDPSKLDF